MGSLYRRKYPNVEGTMTTSPVYWAKFRDAGGILRRESTGTSREGEARRWLRQREGAAVEGRLLPKRVDKVTVRELADDLVAEYRANNRKSVDRLQFSLQHLLPVFGSKRAQGLTAAEVIAYTVERQQAGAANATVNLELAVLKRALKLGQQGEKISRVVHINLLQVDNTRTGFFERPQYEAVKRQLPAALQPVVAVAYLTGWRVKSELLPMRWSQVDFKAGVLTLDPGTTKNKDGRSFPMIPELRAVLEAQRAATNALQKTSNTIIPYVFHRGGHPIKDFMKAWRKACRAAGCPGRIPHDFRRTAVRNLERAGVPRSTAMKMVGHKTEAIYRRYAIVDAAMLAEAGEKLAAYAASQADAPRLQGTNQGTVTGSSGFGTA
jgi:integrase